MSEVGTIEDKAKQALASVRSQIFDAQAALEDWRRTYSTRQIISRRAGHDDLAKVAGQHYSSINKLVTRCITLLGKVEELQRLLDETDSIVNG